MNATPSKKPNADQLKSGPPIQRSLFDLECVIERGLLTFIDVGTALLEIRDGRLYRESYATFEEYCRQRWNWGRSYVNRQIAASEVARNLGTIGTIPKTESQVRELIGLPPEVQREIAAQIDFTQATAADIRQQIQAQPRISKDRVITLEEWKELSANDRKAALKLRSGDTQINKQTTESIEWARWSWNPVTGCLHNCPYCYARDIANRFYQHKFAPAIIPARLAGPRNSSVPEAAHADVGFKNIFVCSMADLFGKWVPAEWIEAVLAEVRANSQWNFLFLTKFPLRMAEFEYPDNAWLGTSVDLQARVQNAERAMRNVKASVRWVSVEPLIEEIAMDWSLFQWVVIGGASASTETPGWLPPRRWVWNLTLAAQAAGCAVYHKDNLRLNRLREYPGVWESEPEKAPEPFHYLREVR